MTIGIPIRRSTRGIGRTSWPPGATARIRTCSRGSAASSAANGFRCFTPRIRLIFTTDDAGLVPKLAMNMWELFEERPVWGRPDLRHALTGRYEKKSEFESALKYLERAMLTTISGQVQPVSTRWASRWAGPRWNTRVLILTLLIGWRAGNKMRPKRVKLYVRALRKNFPALKKSACARYFGRD